MENIKKLLAVFKEKMEDGVNEYTGQCEVVLTTIRQQLDKMPPPPTLDVNLDQLVAEINELVSANAPKEPVADNFNIEALKRACIDIDSGQNQVEVLSSLLSGVTRYASRAALFILKGGQAVGWRGAGFTRLGGDDNRIKSLTFPLGEGSPFFRIQQERKTLYYNPSGDDIVVNQLEGPRPSAVIIVPVVIKDKVAAALYADTLSGDADLHPHVIEILTFITSSAILLLGQREIVPSPSLTSPENLTLQKERASKPTAVPPAEPVPAPEEAVAEAAVEEAEEIAEPAPEPEAPEPPPAVVPEPSVSEATQRLDVKAMQELEELRRKTLGTAKASAQEPSAPVHRPAPEPEEVSEPPASEEMEVEEVTYESEEPAPAAEEWAAPPEVPTPAEEEWTAPPEEPATAEEPWVAPPDEPAAEDYPAEEPAYQEETTYEVEEPPHVPVADQTWQVEETPPTTEWSAPVVEEPAPPPAPAPAPPPAPVREEPAEEPAVKGSTEVKPPPGFKRERVGFGFEMVAKAEGMSEDDARKHDEARRFARLLISEIKLYNEARVKQGREHNTIYELLKEDIDRSYQLFKERIPAEVRNHTDYFKQALVSILAEGRESSLGELPF